MNRKDGGKGGRTREGTLSWSPEETSGNGGREEAGKAGGKEERGKEERGKEERGQGRGDFRSFLG